jgi:hypothetical protein
VPARSHVVVISQEGGAARHAIVIAQEARATCRANIIALEAEAAHAVVTRWEVGAAAPPPLLSAVITTWAELPSLT